VNVFFFYIKFFRTIYVKTLKMFRHWRSTKEAWIFSKKRRRNHCSQLKQYAYTAFLCSFGCYKLSKMNSASQSFIVYIDLHQCSAFLFFSSDILWDYLIYRVIRLIVPIFRRSNRYTCMSCFTHINLTISNILSNFFHFGLKKNLLVSK
jgi:hypothetical protein